MAPSSQPNGRVPVTCLRSRSIVDPPLSPGPGPGILIPQGICEAWASPVHVVGGIEVVLSYIRTHALTD